MALAAPSLPSPIPGPVLTGASGFSLSTAFSNTISAITGPITNPSTGNFFNQAPQLYFTVPFPNNQPTLYSLKLWKTGNLQVAADTVYTFPLTPNSISKQYGQLTAYYDVRGSGPLNGVQRIVDRYGMTLPMITIAGTTGFQFHNMDGFQWSGRSSMANLLYMFVQYASLTQTAVDNNSSTLPIMEFADGFVGDVYQVVPMMNSSVGMDNSKPIYQNYNLQLLAVASVTQPAAVTNDGLGGALIQAQAILTSGFQEYWSGLIGNLTSTFVVT